MDVSLQSLLDLGIARERAESIVDQLDFIFTNMYADQRWQKICSDILDPALPFELDQILYGLNYCDELERGELCPMWYPDPERTTHAQEWMQELELDSYDDLHKWSVACKTSFAEKIIRDLGIVFKQEPQGYFDTSKSIEECVYLPGAQLNIAESCFQADPDATAIICDHEDGKLTQISYAELRSESARVANGLLALGLKPGDRVAISMPMNALSIYQYLGIISAGLCAVCVADSFSSSELELRLNLCDVQYIFIQDVIMRGEKALSSYAKINQAHPCKAIVIPANGKRSSLGLRKDDIAWNDFLSENEALDFHITDFDQAHTILFSSGTTADPKVIPWDHSVPIKGAGDGYLHQDIQAGEVIAWPTNMGWMMGPWLVFASLINKATIALSTHLPTSRAFCEFVQNAEINMLGLVPSLVRAWRQLDATKGLNWSAIKRFSSTGECSNREDMHWLMSRAGYKPVIEYCGGTETGGGYITGTMAKPAIPGLFACPALGFSWSLIDDEVFFEPPVIGLSTRLLNKDHHEIYFADCPSGPDGQVLRRHGDQISALAQGYFQAQGRNDDTMNLGGIKVGSVQIEELLNTLDVVVETAAIAVAPEGGGPSLLVIYAVLNAAAPDDLQKNMQGIIREKLNPLFKIHDVQIIDKMPRTESNKIKRRDLRNKYDQHS